MPRPIRCCKSRATWTHTGVGSEIPIGVRKITDLLSISNSPSNVVGNPHVERPGWGFDNCAREDHGVALGVRNSVNYVGLRFAGYSVDPINGMGHKPHLQERETRSSQRAFGFGVVPKPKADAGP